MKKVLIVSAIFLIATSGCKEPSKDSPFQSIQSGKPLRAFSQFELIDDFNQGIEKNRRGGEWLAETSGGSTLKLASKKENPSKPYGSLLQVAYEISPDSPAKVATALYSLNVGKADFLVGRLRAKLLQEFEGRLSVNLHDDLGRSAQVDLSPHLYNSADEWTDFGVPRQAFNGVDFERLERFEIIIDGASKSPLSGILEIDKIAFYGPENLYFESARSRLKGFPKEHINPKAQQLVNFSDEKFLRAVAQDAWRFFENSVDRNTELVVDNIRVGRVKGIGSYTSTSNIAFYWLACIAAQDLGFISKQEAIKRIDRSLKTVENLERWGAGHFYNYYNTETLKVTRRYVSSVDNGWIAAALVVVRQAFPGKFDSRAEKILNGLNFSIFEDSGNGQLHIGFDEDKNEFSPHHYGLLVSEARLTSYLAIGKGDLPKKHWAKIYRTAPKEWDWQNQVPEGRSQTLFDIPVFQGYYTYQGEKIVPSWGGSLFEFLSPMLLINEQELGKNALSKNNIAATRAHIHYALKEKGYPVWGIAPAGISSGKDWVYNELGIREIAVKGYPDSQIIAPYASILAIEIMPDEVIENMRQMIRLYPDVYGPYGFYDAIEIDRKKVNHQYLALDQGMILVSLANYLTRGAIRNRFHADPIGQNAEVVLTQETFFE